MPDPGNKPAEEIQVIAIKTNRVIISRCWNLPSGFLLCPLERIHVQLVHMRVILAFIIRASNHIHALRIDARLMMR